MYMAKPKKFNHVELEYTFEPLQSVTTDAGRYYVSPDGTKYHSVTTVTGHKKKAFFAEWRRKNPKESKRVTVRGTKFHAIVEDYLNNETPSAVGTEALLFKQALPMLNKIDNIHAQEVPMYSKLLGLAGRVDCVAEYDGKLSIIDFKGSTREKRLEDIGNYFEQATAYAIMWREMTGQNIDQIVILISSEDGTTQEVVDKPINHVVNLRNTIQEFREYQQQVVV